MSGRKRRSKKTGRSIGLVSGLVLVTAIGGYYYRSLFYSTHYLPKTQVQAVDVSNLTTEEANQKVQKTFTSQEFLLNNDQKEWKKINKVDFGLETNFLEELQTIQKEQNHLTWGLSYFKTEMHSLTDAAFNQEKLTTKVDELKNELVSFNKDRKPTKNATLTKQGTEFLITPEQIGDELDIDAILKSFTSDLASGVNSLELNSYKKVPTITKDDPSLTKELSSLNKLATIHGRYFINGNTVEIPQEAIVDWLAYDDGKITLNQEKVHDYVVHLGDTYDTSVNPTTFISSKRGEVSVPPGTYSWTIDTESEAAELSASILAGEDFSRYPIANGSASSGAKLVDKTYVEVDLTTQHMWYYKDGKVVLDTPIVSGKPSTVTPKGVQYIWNKERHSTLKGTNDDGSKYEQPVDYWMPLDWTGVGIHDAGWQANFGNNVWQSAGSHGCINTPPDMMKKLYDSVEVGTPVLIF